MRISGISRALLSVAALLLASITTAQSRPPACVLADVTLPGGEILNNVKFYCGPHGGGAVTYADATLRFTRSVDEIKAGKYPERYLSLDTVSNIAFIDMDDNEKAAAAAFAKQNSDFFRRVWMKADVTLTNGSKMAPIYVWDGCECSSPSETGKLSALKATRVQIRKGSCVLK